MKAKDFLEAACGQREVAMLKTVFVAGMVLSACGAFAQAPASGQAAAPQFEVATIKPTAQDEKGRYLIMQGTNRFVAKAYTLKLMVAAAYNLSPKAISGGPDWIESEPWDILALTPGETRPSQPEQMAMLRTLLSERFKLSFHREAKDLSIYRLEVTKAGSKLKESAAAPSDPPQVISTVYPDRIHLPARNVTMDNFASLLQRAVLDRPVVDSTGLAGRYDFDLDWAPDETQFGGGVPVEGPDAKSPPFFTAIKEQLGLELEATRGSVQALVIDHTEPPSAN
jgi:uncharacterized protein (TIGR03435 family)